MKASESRLEPAQAGYGRSWMTDSRLAGSLVRLVPAAITPADRTHAPLQLGQPFDLRQLTRCRDDRHFLEAASATDERDLVGRRPCGFPNPGRHGPSVALR